MFNRMWRGCCAAMAVATWISAALGADAEVPYWNNVVLDAIRATSMPPPRASRVLAMTQTAIFDAVNSADRDYQPYSKYHDAAPGASLEAAAAQAAYDVLSHEFTAPALQATFAGALSDRLALVVDVNARAAGVALGSAAATDILALRASDNSTLVVPYSPGSNPGDWQPTPPGFAGAPLPNWPQVTPWAMASGSQFRPAPPPALDSPEYAAALADVASLGAIDSASRTAEQTDIARFWADGAGTATPPGHWNLIAQSVVADQNLDLVTSARTFALLDIALADAAISSWDAKYEFDLWRPVTALADTQPGWSPLLVTPPFPTYTSGHSTFSGAASTVLAGLFGEGVGFSSPSEWPGIADREFATFSAAADEAGRSRIYGGIHFEFDNQAGLTSGRALAGLVLSSQLRAVPEPATWLLGALAALGLAAFARGSR